MNEQRMIPVGIQVELDQRIEKARGNITAVRQELEDQLKSLGALQAVQVVQSPEAQGTNGEIALLRGGLLYLDSLAEGKKTASARGGRYTQAGSGEQPAPTGWGARWQAVQPTKTWLLWAFIAGIALTWFVGFTWGGWVSSGNATKMADSTANAAVLQRLAPICVAQFNADPAKEQKLAELSALTTYKRVDYVSAQGWATLPGQTDPDRKVSGECVKLLMQIAQ
jgi:hypothetical protein